MKIVFWGGPLDDQVREIPESKIDRGIFVHEPVYSGVGWHDDPSWFEVVDERLVRYERRDLTAPGIARRRDAPDAWPIMVDTRLTDRELDVMLELRSTPVVDGPREPIEFADVFRAVVTDALTED